MRDRTAALTRVPWPKQVDHPALNSSKIPYVTVAASASAHTKGSWTEVITATTAEANVVDVYLENWLVAAAIGSNLMDIGVGAAASEVAIVSDISLGANEFGGSFRFYVRIPRGSRISVRVQSSTSLNSGLVSIVTSVDENLDVSPSVVTIGANTATSRGIDLTAPGSLNTAAAWTEITASTPEPFSGLTCSTGWASTPSTASGQYALIELGYGASGEEIALPGFWGMSTASGNEGFQSSVVGGAGATPTIVPVNLPAGTRIVARYQRSNATLSVSLVVHAIRPVGWR